MLVSEAVELWVVQRQTEGFSPHTIRSYRGALKRLTETVGDIPVEQITLAGLRAYTAGPACAHLRPSSLAHRVRMLKSFCRWLYEEEHIPRNPALRLREPKQPDRLPKALDFDGLEMLRDAAQGPRERAIIEFLFATGCRAAELSGIRRNAIDWERRAVTVLGKGSKERELYFGARANMWMHRYLDSRSDDCPYLFATERKPIRQLQPHELWRVVKRIAARVGLADRVWPHVMRHTLGTTLLNMGAPLVAVQSILGHESPKTTEIYAKLSGNARQAAYQRFFIQ